MLNVKHKIDIAKFKEHVKNAFEGVGIYEDTKSMIEYVNTGFQLIVMDKAVCGI